MSDYTWGEAYSRLAEKYRYFMARSRLWKRVATKYWRKDYYDVNRMDLEELDATATRRLQLLRRGTKPLNSAQYKIWLEEVEKELGDAN